jgi:oxygen-independent coproporphyrinogen-3 oxidase
MKTDSDPEKEMEPSLEEGVLSPDGVAGQLDLLEGGIRHLYLHLPFCERICPYCDFSTAVGAGSDPHAFLASLKREVDLLAGAGILSHLNIEGGTLYLGGGTPSWFEPDVLARLLSWIESDLGSGWVEATVEVNPEHAGTDRLDVLAEGKINRLSLGVQSFDPAVLRRLGRIHSPGDIADAAATARKGGFALSVDLIFAVPGQQQEAWRRDVESAIELESDHISIYSLTYEPGTPFTRWLGGGRVKALDEEWQADAYSWAAERLSSEGYERYEVSNFSRPGCQSRHNRAYWDGSSYLGLGPSAHSLLGNVRTANIFDLKGWTDSLETGDTLPWASVEALDEISRSRERIMLGLRTSEGVDLNTVAPQYREGVRRQADEIVGTGHARWAGDSVLVLTSRGILLADLLAVKIAP